MSSCQLDSRPSSTTMLIRPFLSGVLNNIIQYTHYISANKPIIFDRLGGYDVAIFIGNLLLWTVFNTLRWQVFNILIHEKQNYVTCVALKLCCSKCVKMSFIYPCFRAGVDGHNHRALDSIHHYNDVIMGAMASQITSLTFVYSTVYSGRSKKTSNSASLAFVRGIHWLPVNSPHKWPVTRKRFPYDDVIMAP